MYRPSDMARLLKFAGVTEPHTATPLMAEVFNIQLRDEEAARRVESKLGEIRVGDRPAILVQREGCAAHREVSAARAQPQARS